MGSYDEAHQERPRVEGWSSYATMYLTISNPQAGMSDGRLVVWADLENHSDHTISPGEVLFGLRIEEAGNFGEPRASSAHPNGDTVPPHSTRPCVIGSLEAEAGTYDITISVEHDVHGLQVYEPTESLRFTVPGATSAPDSVGGDDRHEKFGIDIVDVEPVGPAPGGAHEYRIHFKLSVPGTVQEQLGPVKASVTASGPGSVEGASEDHWLDDPIPVGKSEQEHVVSLYLYPDATFLISVSVAHGAGGLRVHLDAEGRVTSIGPGEDPAPPASRNSRGEAPPEDRHYWTGAYGEHHWDDGTVTAPDGAILKVNPDGTLEDPEELLQHGGHF